MKFFITCFFILFTFVGISQHPYYYHINDEQGLPSNEVYQLIQDDFGFIWIACDAGIFKYDGFNFKPYTSKRQNSRSISNLLKDANGDIWCQNFTGQIFYTAGDSLHLFYDASKESRHYPAYCIDDKNRIWIANDQEVKVFTKAGKCLHTVSTAQMHLPQMVFYDIAVYNEQTMVVSGQLNTLVQINTHDFWFKTVDMSLPTCTRNHLLTIDKQLYLFSETNPERNYFLSQLNAAAKLTSCIKLPLTPGGFNYYIQAIGNELFLCHSNGITVLDKKAAIQSSPTLFEGHKISFCYVDKENNTWITSLQDGIFVVPSLDTKIFDKQHSNLSDNNISTLVKSHNREFMAGTYSGVVYTVNALNGEQKVLLSNKENKYRAVRKIFASKNKLFVARGIFSYIQNGRETALDALNNTRDFYVQGDSVFYISNLRVGLYDLKTNAHTVMHEKGGQALCYDSLNRCCYIACDDGLYKWSGEHLTEMKYAGKRIFASALHYAGKTIWIATHQNQVLQLNIAQQKISALTGIPPLEGLSTVYYYNQHVLFSGNKGLYMYDLNRKKYRYFSIYEGVPTGEINEIIVLNDQVYLASLKGIITFPFAKAEKNTVEPAIKIVHVQSNGKKQDLHKDLVLDYGELNISIEFISTAFKSRQKFIYAYRIRNFNNAWTRISSNAPQVSIPFLPSGDFVFEVKAINEDGLASHKPASIHILVRAPYWQKSWFFILLFLIGSLLVGLLALFRIRYVNQKAREKNKLLLSRLTALKAQMNPHFMFNTLNSIQDLIISNDIKSANYYLSRYAELMRSILKISDSTKIALDDELAFLKTYLELEKLRFGDDFIFDIRVNGDTDVQLPSMIIQPFVENAIKHGLLHKKGKKQLELDFTVTQQTLMVKITDNGIGRKRSAEIRERQHPDHASFATKATEKRIDLLNAFDKKYYHVAISDLYENGNATGTQVSLTFTV